MSLLSPTHRNNKRLAMKRLFVDCTLIDFDRQPTGIPRVVKKYLEEAWRWCSPHGIEVIPVLPTDQGLQLLPQLPLWMSHEQVLQLNRYRTVTRSGKKSTMQASPQTDRMSARFLGRLRQVGQQGTSDNLPERGPPDIIVAGQGDVLFCPAYWHDVDPKIYRGLKTDGVFIATLVHDLLPILFHHCYPTPWRDMFRINAVAATGYADVIFTVSAYTGRAVDELAARAGARRAPSVVAYNGFEPLIHDGLPLGTEYFANQELKKILNEAGSPYIMVGSIEPKKAHVPVVQCFEAMWHAGYERPLIIVGRRGWMDDAIIQRIQQSSFYNTKLFWLDRLDDYDLADAYASSYGMIFASIGEGFGIPMIEAAFYKKALIIYDTEIAREIVGDRARYFSNSFQFVDHIVALEKAAEHERACLSMATLTWPTWDILAPMVFNRIAEELQTKLQYADVVIGSSPAYRKLINGRVEPGSDKHT